MRLPADRFVSFADHAAWQAHHAMLLADRDVVEADPPSLGSCASCRRAACFSHGRCDCPDRLDSPSRALLHAAVEEAGLCGWTRLRLIARPGPLVARLSALAGSVSDVDYDLVIADGPSDPGAMLRAAVDRLAAGGCLLSLLPAFDADEAHGWRVLDAARAHGMSAEILQPWSRELGYLGGVFLLKAVK